MIISFSKRIFTVLTIGVIFSLMVFAKDNNSPSVNLVKVDKSARKMFLLDHENVIKTYSISLGGNPQGHKQFEGDQKTPEGSYTLDFKKENSSFYRAMHISYPNETDKENAQKSNLSPGGAIMIHGQKNGTSGFSLVTQQFDWTNGCIAITNSEMDEFMELVAVGTPIVIQW